MQIKVDQGHLSYSHLGTGLPLLFIHGYPLSRKIWDEQLSDLSDDYRLISIDLRGHGESYPFNPPYPMELLADDCKSILDIIGINGPVVICGLSMGGYISLAFYRKYPELVKAMVLTSTKAAADSPEGKVSRDVTINNAYAHGIPFIVESMLPKLVSPITLSTKHQLLDTIRMIMLETSLNGVVGASLGMRNRPDFTPLLPGIPFPVLIVHGADDQLIPLSEAKKMHQQTPGSHLSVIERAGHLPNMEQPEIYNRTLRDFLQSLD